MYNMNVELVSKTEINKSYFKKKVYKIYKNLETDKEERQELRKLVKKL